MSLHSKNILIKINVGIFKILHKNILRIVLVLDVFLFN